MTNGDAGLSLGERSKGATGIRKEHDVPIKQFLLQDGVNRKEQGPYLSLIDRSV